MKAFQEKGRDTTRLLLSLKKENKMCKCKNIDMGSYDRQTSMKDPFNTRKRNDGWVCIDTCLVQEVAELWHLGIATIECCCGHNKLNGYILVEEKDIKKMKKLGYIKHEEDTYKRDSMFYPLMIINKLKI